MAFTSRVLPLFALALVGAAPLSARAISVDCSDATGMCTVSNDGQDFTTCQCTGGEGFAGGGGNEWAGYDEAQMQLECQQALAFCGPPMPPDGISCETPDGTCTVDNDGFDSVFCECDGAPAGGGTGGNDWTGLDDDQLYEVCLDQVSEFCGPVAGTGIGDTGDATDTDAGTSDAGTGDTGAGDDSGTTGEPGTTGDTGDATIGDTGQASSDGPGTGSGEDTGTGGDASATAGDASATAGDASATAGDASATAGESGETDGGPGESSSDGGCGCTTGPAGGGPLAVAIGMLLGALGRRRRG